MAARFRAVLLALLALALLTHCAPAPAWEVTLINAEGREQQLTRATLEALADFADENGDLPLDRLLYESGYRVIETVAVTTTDGATHTFAWDAAADGAVWHDDGTLTVAGQSLAPERISATPDPLLEAVTVSITDIPVTAAAALGVRAPAAASGRVLTTTRASHVALIFLDGFGYVRYTEARAAGLIPHLEALGAPALGLTVYPPSTVVASAAVLTGAPPEVNGVTRRGFRTTETETLFDVVAAAGHEIVAVEGEALAFNLRQAALLLSGDRDGDGRTDDNVLQNALGVIEAEMPPLLWVHFHGIDDTGHTYGPGAPEEAVLIAYVDAAVGEILAALPNDTLVIIFADHGMHAVAEAGRQGNHGQLIARDMFVPVWVYGMGE